MRLTMIGLAQNQYWLGNEFSIIRATCSSRELQTGHEHVLPLLSTEVSSYARRTAGGGCPHVRGLLSSAVLGGTAGGTRIKVGNMVPACCEWYPGGSIADLPYPESAFFGRSMRSRYGRALRSAIHARQR